TRQASRRQYVLLEVEQYVFVFVRRKVAQLGTEGKLILQTHNGVFAIGLRSCLTNNTAYATATVTNDVVPHHFQTVLRNRESHTFHEVRQTVTTVQQFGGGGVGFGRIVNVLRVCRSTTSLVHRHTVGFRVLFKHRFLPVGEVGRVLLVVSRSNHDLRLVIRERIHQLVAFGHARRHRG